MLEEEEDIQIKPRLKPWAARIKAMTKEQVIEEGIRIMHKKSKLSSRDRYYIKSRFDYLFDLSNSNRELIIKKNKEFLENGKF